MVYNEKYKRWFTKDGLVYRLNKKTEALILCKTHTDFKGYIRFGINENGKCTSIKLHRAMWETFKGEIPKGFHIDHIDTDKANNNIENLRCVTPAENNRNPNTVAKRRAHGHYGEFGLKYYEHYKIQCWQDKKQYGRERAYFQRHGKCSWEVENG